MRAQPELLAALILVCTLCAQSQCGVASAIDGIPFLSQFKSLGQWISGDSKGAKETQENFSKQALGVSQIRSAVEAAKGDLKAAKETQEHFANNIKEVAESTPVLGHIVGGIQVAAGDREHGLETIKGASSSAGAVLGGIAGGLVGGPAGAAAGALAGASAVDGIITGVDSAVNKEFRPFGNIDYVADFKNKSSGEHIDQLFGFGLDALPGSKARPKSGSKPKGKPDIGGDNPKKTDDSINADRSPPGKTDPDDAGSINSHTSTLNDKLRIDEEISDITHMTLKQVQAMSDGQRLKVLQDSVWNLPPEYRNKLRLGDFRDVNSFRGKYNCYLCTMAGASGKLIGRLAKIWTEIEQPIKKFENARDNTDRSTPINKVVKLYQETEFPNARAIVCGSELALRKTLAFELGMSPYSAIIKFGLAYYYDNTNSGHIVTGRAWMENGGLKTLYTDYQVNPDNKASRYTMDPPPNTNGHTIVRLDTKLYEVDFSLYPGGDKIQLGESRAKLAGHIGEERSKVIGRADLVSPKDLPTGARCPWCVTALYAGIPLSGLHGESGGVELTDVSKGGDLQQVLKVYELLGFPDTELLFSGDEQGVYDYLDGKLVERNFAKLVLAYEPNDQSGQQGVNSVLLAVWKGAVGSARQARAAQTRVRLLMTDFNYQPDDPKRFKTSISELDGNGARKLYLIQPKQVVQPSRESLEEIMNEVDTGDMEKGAGCPHKRLIGYVASWTLDKLNIRQAARFTNLIYAFVRMESDGSLNMPSDTGSKQRLVELMLAREALKIRGKQLAVSVAIGGWANSQHFSNVIGDTSQRAHLIQQIGLLLRDFDGVDIDWEYPGTGGATEGKKEDRDNYVDFLKQLRATMAPGKLLSIAGAAGEEALRGFDIKQLTEVVDWIGVMTYDFNGAWESKWGAYVGHNAALHHAAPAGYSGRLNVNWAIKQYVCRSGTPGKIVLGLPFYGRFWTKTSPGKDLQNYPMFRMAEQVDGKFGGEISFRQIENKWFRKRGATRLWDDKSQTPWAYDTKTDSVLTYDNEKSIAAKVAYALEHNLGGVMVWSVDQDDDAMGLTREIGKMCAPTGSDVKYKCNPLGEERRWWQWIENKTNAGMCGRNAPLYNGFYPACDPDDPGFGCCGKFGYCGSGLDHCDCAECVDYTKSPELLVKEPVKPSRPVQWHVGFELVKPGSARCGSMAPPLNDHQAICNQDDDHNHCCSPSGYCGAGPAFCDCPGCKNYRKLSQSESMVKSRRPEEIRWHVGFDAVKPGEPRCGPKVPQVRGQEAICDLDDDVGHCCSPAGYCGAGRDFCDCEGCKDSRKL